MLDPQEFSRAVDHALQRRRGVHLPPALVDGVAPDRAANYTQLYASPSLERNALDGTVAPDQCPVYSAANPRDLQRNPIGESDSRELVHIATFLLTSV